MAPKRRPRAAQAPTQPIPSDYDTDTANITDLPTPHVAPPPQRTNTELNLAVLRRYVPDIQHIVAIAPFAVIYSFSPETQQWEKCGMEGTLFVCQLGGASYLRWNVVVLNRKSLDNFIMELRSADDVELTEEYVILQKLGEDGQPQIFGLWIFSDSPELKAARDLAAHTIQQCASMAQSASDDREVVDDSYEQEEFPSSDYEKEVHNEPPVPAVTGQPIDLLQLLGQQSHRAGGRSTPRANPVSSGPMHQNHFQPGFSTATPEGIYLGSSANPAIHYPQQLHTRSQQQNAMLDLFKNAR